MPLVPLPWLSDYLKFFLAILPYAMWWRLGDKNNKTFLVLVIMKIMNVSMSYINKNIIISWFPDQSKLTQPVQGWLGGETNRCFARSKPVDLKDFLIRSNALNIWLSRNLVT